MVSDVVCEYLVEKKHEKKETLLSAAIITGVVLLVVVLALVILNYPGFTALGIVLIVGAVYLGIKLIGNLSVEYEYCFVNGELTVDKILNKSTRKHVMSLEVKNVLKAGWYNHEKFIDRDAGHIINCSYSNEPTDAIFLQFRDVNGAMHTAILSPSEDFLVKMKPHFNQLVYREGFKK